jgi:hypothetical protein
MIASLTFRYASFCVVKWQLRSSNPAGACAFRLAPPRQQYTLGLPSTIAQIDGFIVVVRSTTALDWEREIWASNVRQFTTKNTPIDQLVSGVKSVDTNGHESLVSA